MTAADLLSILMVNSSGAGESCLVQEKKAVAKGNRNVIVKVIFVVNVNDG